MPFVNPYNFIPLKDGVKKDLGEYYTDGDELLSGRLECRLTTKTPILLPDHEHAKKNTFNGNEYDDYPFMTADGKPMIPGSSIRGVVRSVFEALTDSCVFTNDDYYFSSRTNIAKKAGLLEKTDTGWALREAIRYAAKPERVNDKETGDFVGFISNEAKNARYVKEILPSPDGSPHTGYVLKMNQIRIEEGKLSAYSVIEQKPGGETMTLDQKFIDTFEVNLEKYAENEKEKEGGGNRARVYKQKYAGMKTGDLLPVWYEKDDSEEGCYLAPSQLSRNIYTKKPKDFLKKKNLDPCTSRKKLCPACALFGFVASGGGNEGSAIGSRVRFSDAWPTGAVEPLKSRLLPVLASPRSSSLEFYLRHPARFYHADTKNAELAGRKIYWHHSEFDIEKLNVTESPNMTCFMQPVDKGNEFSFNVYFDQITKRQLDQLFTALTLGENEKDSLHCHKVGHGKPVGFGSVKITVGGAYSRSYSDAGYCPEESLLENIKASLADSPVAIPEALSKATDFEAAKGFRIDYPRMAEKGDIFQWFSKNRPVGIAGKGTKFETKLPFINDEDITLPNNPKDGNSQGQARVTPGQAAGKEEPLNKIRIKQAEKKTPTESAEIKEVPKKVRLALNASVRNPDMKETLKGFVSDYEANPAAYAKFEKDYKKAKDILGL